MFLTLNIMNTKLAEAIIELERLSVNAFEAGQRVANTEFEFYSQEKQAHKEAEKLQATFEKAYHALVLKFRLSNEDAKNYVEWNTISPLEFMEEVNNK